MTATILTDVASRIQIKRILAILIIFSALTFLTLKFWVFYKFTPCSTFYSIEWLNRLFGIYPGRWVHTFLSDLIVITFAALLTWYYSDQLKQLEEKANFKGSLKFQDRIKLLHFEFGKKHEVFFGLAIALFLVNTIIYMTFVDLLILSFLMLSLFKWALMEIITGKAQKLTVRLSQGVVYLFHIVGYYFQYQMILGADYQKNIYFKTFGLQNESFHIYDETRLAFHKILLSFAFVYGQAYFASRKIYDETGERRND
jgi:hypothetical protein